MSAVVFIPLTQGKVAVIDFADFEKVRGFEWHAHKSQNRWYARSRCGGNTKSLLHRFLLGAAFGTQVDHIDGDGLNNQRENLRFATQTQNSQGHRRKPVNSSSQFRGVTRDGRDFIWQANIRVAGKLKYLGRFVSEETAARAYDAAAIKYFGEFAALNFS